jgi:uncharacterized membrane protein YfcA
MTIAPAPALGAVIGVLLGLLGGGGSILAVPALVYALGLASIHRRDSAGEGCRNEESAL